MFSFLSRKWARSAALTTASVPLVINAFWGLESPFSLAAPMEKWPWLAQKIEPERAHDWFVSALSCPKVVRRALGLVTTKDSATDENLLQTTVFGKTFSNPIGMAAGFDKDGRCPRGVIDMGMGFTELGTVTPDPQEGNSKPRVFRYSDFGALVNRCGFNSAGLDSVMWHLKTPIENPYAINIGPNKTSKGQRVKDDFLRGICQATGVNVLHPPAYITLNLSSPNTPDLRNTQNPKFIKELDQEIDNRLYFYDLPHFLVKVSPDLPKTDRQALVKACLKSKKIAGLVVSNTTVNHEMPEQGGLSGQPLRDLSTDLVGEYYKLSEGKLNIIGVGGIRTGQDAYEKIRNGASLVQLYSAVALEGPRRIPAIKKELCELLRRDGFESVEEAVGANFRE